MSSLGYVEAFAKCGAKLTNPNWAVSAIAADGAFVMSGWAHYFRKPAKDALLHQNSLSRWIGNEPGRNLLESHLAKAFAERLLVKMIVATAEDPAAVERDRDASKIKKTFHLLENLIGEVTEFNGDIYVIEFRRR